MIAIFALLLAFGMSGSPAPPVPDASAPVSPRQSDPATAAVPCAPALSRAEVLDVVRRLVGAASTQALLADFDVNIEPRGCEYSVVATTRDPVAVEPLYYVIDRTGRVTNPPTCWWLGDLGNCPLPFDGSEMPLESLRSQCHLQRAWVGATNLPHGAWLFCESGSPVLVLHPMNLLGKVQILDEESALSYLQFFSSPDTYQLFQLEGMLDLSLLNGSGVSRLRRTLRDQGENDQPRVTSTTANSFCVTSSATLAPCTRSTFIVSRLALFYDGNVYRLTEELHEDGSYELTSKVLVLRDVGQFGVTHEPPALDRSNLGDGSDPP